MAKTKVESPVVEMAEQTKWRAEDALRDLTRAEEHRADPKLMKEVEKMRKEKMKALASIKCEVSPMSKGMK
jgi:hypothetical protein